MLMYKICKLFQKREKIMKKKFLGRLIEFKEDVLKRDVSIFNLMDRKLLKLGDVIEKYGNVGLCYGEKKNDVMKSIGLNGVLYYVMIGDYCVSVPPKYIDVLK